MNDAVVTYQGQQVSVPKEVADFLEWDRRRMRAQYKRDQRHLSRRNFETVLSSYGDAERVAEDAALKNLQLETLRETVAGLDEREQNLIFLRYGEELSMEEIGRRLGVSRMAISKRLRTLNRKLNRAVSCQRGSIFIFHGLQTVSECPM